MHCRRFLETPLSRRDMLLHCGATASGPCAVAALFREPAFGAAVGDVPADVAFQSRTDHRHA